MRERVRALLAAGEAGWCDMTRLELWAGAGGEDEKRRLRLFERDLPLLEISHPVWALTAHLEQVEETLGRS